ncbi:uncharacterized protein LOC112521613 [Cynara cardunculus var. scolymus]|uniref:Uncharacterized protein n=1 Tax=Cynara cardunculus var. scolymus TaxID=59895 RepID=A0A103XHU2_CYNCS|nr:uncharacterized protein LOC112521613 [Cynara cardunculus var. scolymus]KVH90944.1 hypothetical protein Ccrd_007082 [Cynara cardunculus var. scolymus]
MKSIFMRVLFCKIHCPSFICFCKPSTATHLYNPGPLKLENSTHAPPLSLVTDPSDQNHVSPDVEEIIEVEEKEILEDGKQEPESIVLRSCMKNNDNSQSRSPIERKKVQWMDNLGKELVDIKEFESSETGDTDNEDDDRSCFCTIL